MQQAESRLVQRVAAHFADSAKLKTEAASVLGEPIARADFFVNMPKFKAHPWTTVTFSMKNYIGIQDDRHRLVPELLVGHAAAVFVARAEQRRQQIAAIFTAASAFTDDAEHEWVQALDRATESMAAA